MSDETTAGRPTRLTQHDIARLLVHLGGMATDSFERAPSFGDAENYFLSTAASCYREASEALARGEKAEKPADQATSIVIPTNFRND